MVRYLAQVDSDKVEKNKVFLLAGPTPKKHYSILFGLVLLYKKRQTQLSGAKRKFYVLLLCSDLLKSHYITFKHQFRPFHITYVTHQQINTFNNVQKLYIIFPNYSVVILMGTRVLMEFTFACWLAG